MPTYKQVVNHVKKHVLWKEEYFERYYRLNPELVQKRLDKIYQAEDDLMVLISTQLFCFLQANGTLYFDSCYKTGKADNSLLCTNLALWSIGLACDHFDIREERGHTTKFSEQGESWLTLFACNQFSLVPYFAVDDILQDFEAVGFFHGEHPGVMYSHRKRLIRKMRVVV